MTFKLRVILPINQLPNPQPFVNTRKKCKKAKPSQGGCPPINGASLILLLSTWGSVVVYWSFDTVDDDLKKPWSAKHCKDGKKKRIESWDKLPSWTSVQNFWAINLWSIILCIMSIFPYGMSLAIRKASRKITSLPPCVHACKNMWNMYFHVVFSE